MLWLRKTGRSLWSSLRLMLVLTAILGIAYPLVITAIGQWTMPGRANGSKVSDTFGHVVGSSLLAQSFTDQDGKPLPQYFQPRPSAVDYDAGSSGASNMGPEDPALVNDIALAKKQIAKFNGVPESAVPPDAVTMSGSGLDPDISPAYAQIQIARVARARGLSVDQVAAVVHQNTHGPELGYIGNACVNVLDLNLALDAMQQ